MSARATPAERTDWRLIVDGEGPGPWNMGIDEALLASAAAGARPTLRLYRWNGPWLSLGYSQRLSEQHLVACREAGVGIVTRVTGGGAVLHSGDVTYALAAHESELPVGIEASYALVCRALTSALARLGVRVESASGGAHDSADPAFGCFARLARHEIGFDGRKLAGSAQRRAGGGVLQHGSIRLIPRDRRIERACGLGADDATSLAEIGATASLPDIERALVAGFEAVLGCRFEPGTPTAAERTRAATRTASAPPGRAFAPGAQFQASRQPFASR